MRETFYCFSQDTIDNADGYGKQNKKITYILLNYGFTQNGGIIWMFGGISYQSRSKHLCQI